MASRKPQPPCIFKGAFIREQVDPRIKEEWGASHTGRPPWGDWRKQWKLEHCRRVSGSGFPEDCAYDEQQCATAFLQAARIAMDGEKPGALFRAVAAVSGMRRADDKPLARDLERPARAGGPPGRPLAVGASGTAAERLRAVAAEAERHLSGRRARPVHIGQMLRPDDTGPRQGPDARGDPAEAPQGAQAESTG